ncbi:MAG: hypothetical protein ACK5KO_11610 [Arachnia sp.]
MPAAIQECAPATLASRGGDTPPADAPRGCSGLAAAGQRWDGTDGHPD